VANEIGDRVPFVPGTGSTKLDETLELTSAARDAGADAVLIITPYYARPTQEALYVWYSTVAREFPDLPIVAYNVPSRTAVEIAPETVGRLFRDHDNFVGVKETTKDFEHFSRVIHAAGPDLVVWSGIELLCLPVLSLGGAGFLSALANIAPAAVAEMYEAATNGAQEGRLMTIGIAPTRPETGYGYLQCSARAELGVQQQVLEFKEKPTLPVATEYVASGRYLWNASMFVWRTDVFLGELEKRRPDVFTPVSKIAEAWDTDARDDVIGSLWTSIPKVAVEYAVMEPAAADGLVATVPGDFGWSDIGDFETLARVRRYLGANPYGALELLHAFMTAWGINPQPTDP
ncbi:dihydrodipicolinate synthase family protein, partial [Kibdelosporangium lantanae]